MIKIFLILLIVFAVLSIHTARMYTVVVYLGIFSLTASFCYFLFAAPDAAMAEAVVSTLSTILFLVAIQKHFTPLHNDKPKQGLIIRLLPPAFILTLFILFIIFIPDSPANTYLKDEYISEFAQTVGGVNAVTAIYLGYRMYDTIFEALMLLISIVAIIYLSWHTNEPGEEY